MHLVYLKPAFVFYAAQTVAASGSGNVTADADGFAPPWVGNPQGRGTLTIVIKCVTTLLLAAWVPLHLNIPSFEQSIGARCRGFGFWATFTFLIPEWVVYIAFEQWRQMRKFLGEMKRARKELHEKQNSGISDVVRLLLQERFAQLKAYTWAYGWCATMGYFTISLPHPRNSHSARDTRSIFPENRRVTFTAFGIISLARLGVILHVPDSAIPHNTAADYILKGVSLCQVLWFLCTIVLRKAESLPLALLEISTLIRVVCGITMYLSWWKKPANLQTTSNDQITALDQTVPKMLAHAIDEGTQMFCLTNSGKMYALLQLNMWFNHQHLFCCFCTKEWDASKVIIQQGGARAIIYALEKDTVLEETATPDGHELRAMTASNKLVGQLSTLERTSLMPDLEVIDSGALDLTAQCPVNHTDPVTGAEVDRRDEESCRQSTNKRSSPPSTHAEDVGARTYLMVEIAQGFVKPSIANFSWFRISFLKDPAGRRMIRLKMEDVSWHIVVGYILILAFAGIHLATHYAGFKAPTPVEGMMWNISCYIIASWVVVFLGMEIYFFTASRISGRRGSRYDCWNPAVRTYDWSIWKCLLSAAFCGAVLSGRLFLMVEAFISLRKEKVEVFFTPGSGWWFG